MNRVRRVLAALRTWPAHELYKCAALTVIAILLAVIAFGTADVDGDVWVRGGSVDVTGTVQIDR